MRFNWAFIPAAVFLSIGVARGAEGPTDFKFQFGSGKVDPAYIQVKTDDMYSKNRGYGFEPSTSIPAPGTGAPVPNVAPTIQATESGVTSAKPFLFSVALPEGNYRVSVTMGDSKEAATTTVKSESRVLMLESVHTGPGQIVTRSFAVNIHGPRISTGGQVKLDARENGVFHWDDKLTLEFMDARPAIREVEIHKADDAVTVFLCSDSTVTTQVREPYGTWGQMLPRWFDDHVAVADYAESGETLKAFKSERRWDKVMSEVKPGDYVFMQFGHNDLNKKGHNAIWPADDPAGDWSKTYSEANTDYKELLEQYAGEVKAKGAIAIIVSPMTKINIRTGELNIAGLGDYPKAAVLAAKEAGVACIDLNAMSIELVKGLGALAPRAYVEGLHSTSYGGYLFSRCIVEGIRQNKLALANHIAADAGTFDPSHPLPLPDDFKLPLEPSPPRGFGRGRGTTRPATVPSGGIRGG